MNVYRSCVPSLMQRSSEPDLEYNTDSIAGSCLSVCLSILCQQLVELNTLCWPQQQLRPAASGRNKATDVAGCHVHACLSECNHF